MNMEMNKSNKIKEIVLIIASLVIIGIIVLSLTNKKEEEDEPIVNNDNYNTKIIKAFNEQAGNSNYLLSPYSIEIALNMLREGADGNTKEEISNLIGNRTINDVSVKDIIGVANAIFIKDQYQNDVKNEFYDTLKTKYNSDIIYDEFSTPYKINNWVNEKTYGMIEKILENMDKDYVMGLANALAIDVKWKDPFDCNSTESSEFTKNDNTVINVEMMHKKYERDAKYLKTDEVEGIVIPYKVEDDSNIELEFVGLLPNSDLNSFIKGLTNDKLNNILNNQKEAGSNLNINLSLPRFQYDYNTNNFIGILNNLGIKEAFDPIKANFKRMIEIDENVYVGEAIHKTHIELNEVGTKAAAVTYFAMFKNGSIPSGEIEIINIDFNKPFAYMVREKNTGEVLFFGTVYEPNIWNGSTCK